MDKEHTVDQIITKAEEGRRLTAWENSVYLLNVRPDGSRYSADTKTRKAQYEADIKA